MNSIMEDTKTINKMFDVYKNIYQGKDNKNIYRKNLS